QVAQVIKTKDLKELAQLWIKGNSIPWERLYDGKKLSRTAGLPTYPFKRRRCPVSDNRVRYPGEDSHINNHGDYENKAAEFYTLAAKDTTEAFQEEYLTFCPFPGKVAGFSMSQVFLNPGSCPDELVLMKEKQLEMRQVLFCKENFDKIHKVFDIGCGFGTDVIQIAARYPHIQTHGFTITRAQADLGKQRIAQKNPGSQAKIFH
ncbi:MAG: hypothetical protein GY950_28350, partial [bacterium]|nr:hypothetical protein [bacterium]